MITCDRCLPKREATQTFIVEQEESGDIKTMELCPECAEDFDRFLRGFLHPPARLTEGEPSHANV